MDIKLIKFKLLRKLGKEVNKEEFKEWEIKRIEKVDTEYKMWEETNRNKKIEHNMRMIDAYRNAILKEKDGNIIDGLYRYMGIVFAQAIDEECGFRNKRHIESRWTR